jgi:hypothetical protein
MFGFVSTTILVSHLLSIHNNKEAKFLTLHFFSSGPPLTTWHHSSWFEIEKPLLRITLLSLELKNLIRIAHVLT